MVLVGLGSGQAALRRRAAAEDDFQVDIIAPDEQWLRQQRELECVLDELDAWLKKQAAEAANEAERAFWLRKLGHGEN